MACWGRVAQWQASLCPSSTLLDVPSRRNQMQEMGIAVCNIKESTTGRKRHSHQSVLEMLKILFVCSVIMILRLLMWKKAKHESLIRAPKCSYYCQWIINTSEKKPDRLLEEELLTLYWLYLAQDIQPKVQGSAENSRCQTWLTSSLTLSSPRPFSLDTVPIVLPLGTSWCTTKSPNKTSCPEGAKEVTRKGTTRKPSEKREGVQVRAKDKKQQQGAGGKHYRVSPSSIVLPQLMEQEYSCS